MASDMSVPSSAVKSVAVSTLVALCASAAPLPAHADDLPPPQMQPFGAPQMQQPGSAARISGRVTYSRLLEFVDEGSVSPGGDSEFGHFSQKPRETLEKSWVFLLIRDEPPAVLMQLLVPDMEQFRVFHIPSFPRLQSKQNVHTIRKTKKQRSYQKIVWFIKVLPKQRTCFYILFQSISHVTGLGFHVFRFRKRVDFYDLGKTAVALVNVAGREQQLVCDLPGGFGEFNSLLKQKLVCKSAFWTNFGSFYVILLNLLAYFLAKNFAQQMVWDIKSLFQGPPLGWSRSWRPRTSPLRSTNLTSRIHFWASWATSPFRCHLVFFLGHRIEGRILVEILDEHEINCRLDGGDFGDIRSKSPWGYLLLNSDTIVPYLHEALEWTGSLSHYDLSTLVDFPEKALFLGHQTEMIIQIKSKYPSYQQHGLMGPVDRFHTFHVTFSLDWSWLTIVSKGWTTWWLVASATALIMIWQWTNPPFQDWFAIQKVSSFFSTATLNHHYQLSTAVGFQYFSWWSTCV